MGTQNRGGSTGAGTHAHTPAGIVGAGVEFRRVCCRHEHQKLHIIRIILIALANHFHTLSLSICLSKHITHHHTSSHIITHHHTTLCTSSCNISMHHTCSCIVDYRQDIHTNTSHHIHHMLHMFSFFIFFIFFATSTAAISSARTRSTTTATESGQCLRRESTLGRCGAMYGY